jgi:hypothetical protein
MGILLSFDSIQPGRQNCFVRLPFGCRYGGRYFALTPFPVSDFGQVLAVLIDEMFVFDQLVFHLLLQVGAFGTQIWHPIHHVLHQMKTVNFILHPHVEWRRNGALFLVTADVEIAIGPAVGKFVDQPGIAVEIKNDVFVFREK